MTLFRPKHTLASVIVELYVGLQDHKPVIEESMRSSADEALQKTEESMVDGLLRALRDKDGNIAFYLFRAWKIGEPAVKALIKALRDKDPNVRYGAAHVLGQFRDARPVDGLRKALRDKDPDVRSSAARALGWTRDARAVDGLVRALRDKDDNVAYFSSQALEMIGKPAVDALIKALHDSDSKVRSSAAETLGLIGDRSAIQPLSSAVNDVDPSVRLSVRRAIIRIGGPEPPDDRELSYRRRA